ncbi:uncharacterized protein BDZ99DRAFT_463679 [Mytilinidion resinicola]|uniref:Uncharacterized protein n=1 Tax=Mytilinidion resinicola TaxID=574789 RepID=A0A6A6YJ19_9PEZI|nr:uncharacterized protein BDZ99DRAFT_463679 [Mytilinidion resinicola]KAF2808801.1 hypothetical protein BDZ99DRAFT_463679 [Mytilinidion resinicola]
MPFTLAKSLEKRHLIVQPSDLALNPPQSYLFVQDFLILSCAILYCFCYIFYTIRTKRDRFLAVPIDLMYVYCGYKNNEPRCITHLHACQVWQFSL